MSQPVDRETSRRLAAELASRPVACWMNALEVLGALAGQAVYVEGFVVRADMPIVLEHGWCETADGIIDTSPAYLDADAVYFAGVRYTRFQVAALLNQYGDLPSFLPFVWHTHAYGFQHPDYDRARELAECLRHGRRVTPAFARPVVADCTLPMAGVTLQ